MPFVVTMSVKSKEIARSIVSSVPISVVDLDDVLIGKEQSTPSTSSRLPLQRFGYCSAEERVCFQSLAPVKELPVIWTRFTLDFDVSLDVRLTVLSELGALRCRKHPVAVFLSLPVFPVYPLTSFVQVSCSRPSPKLVPQDIVTASESHC